jgi:TolA-binding protein
VAFAFVLAIVAPAAAQMETREGIALQNQILELRHELQILQAQRGAPPPYSPQPAYPQSAPLNHDTAAQLVTRVGSLEEQMRELRGRVDELANAFQRAVADLSKQIEDMKFQAQNPQGAQLATPPPGPRAPGLVAGTPPAASPSTGAPPPPPGPVPTPDVAPPPPPTGPRTPELALQEGYAALARRDYATAERDAQEVLAKRASPRAYDAQYLLAQSLAGQHQWSRAAIAYDDAYTRAPKGGHAEEALLGLATSLAFINEKRAACETLNKLRTEFPKPRAELRDQITAISQHAGCRA